MGCSTSHRACRALSSLELAAEVERGLRHAAGEVEAVRVRARHRRVELEVRAAALACPRGRRVEQAAADALAPAPGRDHQVLEPAAPAAADGHRATTANASSVTSSTRATSASPSAAEMNQLWCGWRYTPCAAQAAAKTRLRSKEPSSATKVMNGMAGGPP